MKKYFVKETVTAGIKYFYIMANTNETASGTAAMSYPAFENQAEAQAVVDGLNGVEVAPADVIGLTFIQAIELITGNKANVTNKKFSNIQFKTVTEANHNSEFWFLAGEGTNKMGLRANWCRIRKNKNGYAVTM